MIEEKIDHSLTRRTLIKRAAIGAAAVWTAPLLTSTASADAGEAACKTHCAHNTPCGNCSIGFSICKTKNNTNCYCFTGNSGCCRCLGDVFCSQTITCNTDTDCKQMGRGWKCITVNGCTGCGGGGVCAPPCGKGIAAGASGGRRASDA